MSASSRYWEYLTTTSLPALEKLGAEGWEVCGVIPPTEFCVAMILLKRETYSPAIKEFLANL